LHRKRADGAGGTDLAAVVAARLAARPVGLHLGRPEALETLPEAHRLEHVVEAGLEALAAADALLQELLLGNAAGRTDGQILRRRRGNVRAEKPLDRERRGRAGDRRREEAAPRGFPVGRRLLLLQVREIPARDELDRVGRADAAAALAERAVGHARVVVGLDGVEGTDLHALVAADAARLHLPLRRAEEIAEREDLRACSRPRACGSRS